MFGSIGLPELFVILVIVLVIFGSSRLPEMGKSLGQAIRGFKKALSESEKSSSQRSDHKKNPAESAKP